MSTNLFVDVDDSANTVKKKVREAQISQYNYILVIGEKEEAAKTVHVRLRDDGTVIGAMSVDDLLERMGGDLATFK